MATMTYDIITDFTSRLASNADALGQRRGLVLGVGLAIAVIRGERQSMAAINAMRAAISICAKACESGACLAEVYQTTKLIRDNYIKIADGMNKLPLPGFFKRRINASLAEWDELAEDCVVGGDEDIRRTLHAIGSRL